jgi:GNAT superfamily N-acetyltransferase
MSGAAGQSDIALAETEGDIARCHSVMCELRPHCSDRAEFVAQVQRQHGEGFRVAFLEHDGEVRAVAGFRVMELLFSGKTLYVDDLVTRETDRSRGFGGELFDWMVQHAREQNCKMLTLDSGVHRFDAHRFYLSKRMKIWAHHFVLDL